MAFRPQYHIICSDTKDDDGDMSDLTRLFLETNSRTIRTLTRSITTVSCDDVKNVLTHTHVMVCKEGAAPKEFERVLNVVLRCVKPHQDDGMCGLIMKIAHDPCFSTMVPALFKVFTKCVEGDGGGTPPTGAVEFAHFVLQDTSVFYKFCTVFKLPQCVKDVIYAAACARVGVECDTPLNMKEFITIRDGVKKKTAADCLGVMLLMHPEYFTVEVQEQVDDWLTDHPNIMLTHDSCLYDVLDTDLS